jgi:hypothetical protein
LEDSTLADDTVVYFPWNIFEDSTT